MVLFSNIHASNPHLPKKATSLPRFGLVVLPRNRGYGVGDTCNLSHQGSKLLLHKPSGDRHHSSLGAPGLNGGRKEPSQLSTRLRLVRFE